LYYDFQGAGEYLLVSSSDGEVIVQARQEPWRGSNFVSVNTAVAMQVSGDRVGVHLDRSPNLYVNGQPTSLIAGPLYLPNGGKVFRVAGSSRTQYLVEWPNGFLAGVKVSSSYLDIGVAKPPELESTFGGILGNLNGIAEDDAFLRDGNVLPRRIPFPTLYGAFGNGWRISQSESLFDYDPGTTTETFTLLDFPQGVFTADDLEPAVYESARLVCEAAGITDPILLTDCILDVAVTGESEFTESGVDSAQPEIGLEVVQIVNGGFDRNAEGWFWKNINSEGGWKSTGGNPDGNFVLNQSGENATDPTLCQTVEGFGVGHDYRLTGDYASYKPQYGNPSKPNAFAVTLDGAVVLELPRPSPVPTAWTAFTTGVISGAEAHTLCFVAERQGDDSSFRVDNIALKGTEPPP
jgi:hypothetical protein